MLVAFPQGWMVEKPLRGQYLTGFALQVGSSSIAPEELVPMQEDLECASGLFF
jgi:hypothetical protein